MLRTLVKDLACAECRDRSSSLALVEFLGSDSGHVEWGILTCDKCRAVFLVQDGVTELVTKELCDQDARRQFAERFRRELSERQISLSFLGSVGDTGREFDDQVKQRKHFDWYAENDTQSYSQYQRTPFWLASDERTFVRWRPMVRDDAFILDIGCADGRGGFQFLDRPQRRLVGFDISKKMVEKAAARAKAEGVYDRCSFLVADANSPPFKEGVFDCVVTFGVLHHLPDPGRSCREIQLILKEGGLHLALENNKTLLRPIFDLAMKFRPIWIEEAGQEPLISKEMVEEWISGLPTTLTVATSVFLPPHLFNLVGLPVARRLLKVTDELLSRVPLVGEQGGLIVFEVAKRAPAQPTA